MFPASVFALQAQADQAFRAPSSFTTVVLLLLVGGALAWLVAAVLGFTRARVYGPAARWFALAAVCMVLFHLHILLIGFAMAQRSALTLGAFFNLFVLLAAVCAIIGFTRLNKE